MSLAENIAKYRNAAGETQGQLAELLGVSNRTVSKWENAEGEPDVTAMMKIAAHYGATLDELCGFEAVPSKNNAAPAPNEAALRAFSGAFDVLKRLRADICEGEDGFVPPSLLKEDYQESGCRATGVFTSRIFSLFVNSPENNLSLNLLRNSENFGWLDTMSENFSVLLGFLADPDIRKLLIVLLTETFPFYFTSEYAAEAAGIPEEKAEAFLKYTTHSQEVELLEGRQQIYWGIQSRKLGLYLAILSCAYETFGNGDTFEIYNANYQPIFVKEQEV
ncbi:MAG: helix-turn-helix transcriptional regulator [Clostridia bacterium]|nr:helix-turn-helix transcriptional regulator [Clostridia bacterium]